MCAMMVGCCEGFLVVVCMTLFYTYLAGTATKIDDCDIRRAEILQTCQSWNMCENQLKTMRCRSNPVKARLSSELFHPYVVRLMFEGGAEFFEVFGKSNDIALMSLTHSIFNDEGGAIDFIKLVGGVADSDEAELIALKLPLRSRELVYSPFCEYYRANITKTVVPDKYELWKKEVTDRVCLLL